MTRRAPWLIVTDAGFEVGHGHLSRSTVMASAVAESGARVRLCLPRTLRTGRDSEGVVVVPFTEDGLGTMLAGLAADNVLLLDLPDESLERLAWLRGWPGFRAAFRMFGPTGASIEHLSLTPSYRPDESVISNDLPLVSLSGWSNIVIRPGLFEEHQVARHGPVSVLITMGGSDPHDLTTLVCQALAGMACEVRLVVAVGGGNPRFERLEADYGSVMTVMRPTEPEFDDLLKSATVAVISGGLTRYECIAAGTPFVAVALHDQQAAITREVTSRGFGIDAGPYERLEPAALVTAVNHLLADAELRAAMISSAHRHVDRDAPRRIVKRILDLRAELPWAKA